MDAARDVHWLVAMARFEEELEKTRGEASRLERRREQLRTQLAESEQASDTARKLAQDATRSVRQLEREIEDLEARAAGLRQKQQQIKDNKTYQLLGSEIDALQKKIDQTETEALRKIEAADRYQLDSAGGADEFEARRQQNAAEQQRIETTARKLETGRDELENEITTCLGQLSRDLAAKVGRIRKRQPLSVVFLDEQACGGCHAQFPTQTALEIDKGLLPFQCPSCGRYVVPHA